MNTMLSKTFTAHDILQNWLDENGKSIAQLNRDLGYKSNYCYLILAPSNPRPITFDVIGRLEVRFGSHGPARKMAKVMRQSLGCMHSNFNSINATA